MRSPKKDNFCATYENVLAKSMEIGTYRRHAAAAFDAGPEHRDLPQRLTALDPGTSAQYFTGSVRIDPLFSEAEPSRVSGARVTFEPGARTAWHTHPLGQTLIVTAGTGWVQQWGGPVQEMHEGDVVRIPPGQKHWHGATRPRA